MSKAINRILSDIGRGRHLEAYAIFVLGLALTVPAASTPTQGEPVR